MAIRLERHRRLADGRVERFEPLRNADGYYVLADRAVDPQHNRACNQFYIKDLAVVAARLRRGGVSLRMRGSISRQPNLISSGEIEIIDDSESAERPTKRPREPHDGDPFAEFSEWASAADDDAYAGL